MSARDVVAATLILVGCVLGLLGGFGVVRLPDVYGRMHAATKPPTLGLVLVALGAMLRVDSASDVAFLVLVVLLQFLTAPVGAHLIGRAAHDSGGLEDPATIRDDLADHDASEPHGDTAEGE